MESIIQRICSIVLSDPQVSSSLSPATTNTPSPSNYTSEGFNFSRPSIVSRLAFACSFSPSSSFSLSSSVPPSYVPTSNIPPLPYELIELILFHLWSCPTLLRPERIHLLTTLPLVSRNFAKAFLDVVSRDIHLVSASYIGYLFLDVLSRDSRVLGPPSSTNSPAFTFPSRPTQTITLHISPTNSNYFLFRAEGWCKTGDIPRFYDGYEVDRGLVWQHLYCLGQRYRVGVAPTLKRSIEGEGTEGICMLDQKLGRNLDNPDPDLDQQLEQNREEQRFLPTATTLVIHFHNHIPSRYDAARIFIALEGTGFRELVVRYTWDTDGVKGKRREGKVEVPLCVLRGFSSLGVWEKVEVEKMRHDEKELGRVDSDQDHEEAIWRSGLVSQAGTGPTPRRTRERDLDNEVMMQMFRRDSAKSAPSLSSLVGPSSSTTMERKTAVLGGLNSAPTTTASAGDKDNPLIARKLRGNQWTLESFGLAVCEELANLHDRELLEAICAPVPLGARSLSTSPPCACEEVVVNLAYMAARFTQPSGNEPTSTSSNDCSPRLQITSDVPLSMAWCREWLGGPEEIDVEWDEKELRRIWEPVMRDLDQEKRVRCKRHAV